MVNNKYSTIKYPEESYDVYYNPNPVRFLPTTTDCRIEPLQSISILESNIHSLLISFEERKLKINFYFQVPSYCF